MSRPGRAARAGFHGSIALAAALVCGCGGPSPGPDVERDVAVPMRDGVVLRANVWRPAGPGPFPVLVYRTPYGKDATETWYETHLRATERGYAVVLQDVRGRYASEGDFEAYRNEGRDGYDTIEWAAAEPWSNGKVGTFGLSYPGAVQWLAALERPPHLVAMAPAMTFSSPRHFFYFGGVFDNSWLPWVLGTIAPDLRRRRGLPGAHDEAAADAWWQEHGDELRARLPLSAVPELRDVAPFYYDWLAHEPTDPWWDWGEIRGRYGEVDAAVLNLSGWYDEAYGPEGATTNFNGLVAARRGDPEPRTRLVLGPWVHGVRSVGQRATGDLDFGLDAALDYDDLVLDWMDLHVRGIADPDASAPLVRYFVMGENRWHDAATWPPEPAEPLVLYLRAGGLAAEPPAADGGATLLASDPAAPLTDPYSAFGPHDYGGFVDGGNVRLFDSTPLERDLEVTGGITAEIHLACDCPDTDLVVKLLDVAPDGKAFNLMSPGLDVQRASYRDPTRGRQLLVPGEIYRLTLDNLMTSHLFRRGHRIRVQISTAFFPHLSRNLHTGELETESATTRRATVTLFHDAAHPSRIVLPVPQH
ncbi:MAG: CocE/NonD family hydrolase [Acidobacteriota bacterium]|nr:CocE/NonD family hydrolase [Acidobacteriota bacterium]